VRQFIQLPTLPLAAPRPALQVVDGSVGKVAPQQVSIRRARLDDVETMYRLLDGYARQGLLLPRKIQDVYRNIREFVVAVDENDAVVGCGGLRLYTSVLGEIIALAVDDRAQGQGVGRRIVDTLIKDARGMDLCRLFAMTLQPVFFEKVGFVRQSIALFPEKIAIDCSGCAKRATCTEITMVLDL
jgi:amino-acid N-acetyltransferase